MNEEDETGSLEKVYAEISFTIHIKKVETLLLLPRLDPSLHSLCPFTADLDFHFLQRIFSRFRFSVEALLRVWLDCKDSTLSRKKSTKTIEKRVDEALTSSCNELRKK